MVRYAGFLLALDQVIQKWYIPVVNRGQQFFGAICACEGKQLGRNVLADVSRRQQFTLALFFPRRLVPVVFREFGRGVDWCGTLENKVDDRLVFIQV